MELKGSKVIVILDRALLQDNIDILGGSNGTTLKAHTHTCRRHRPDDKAIKIAIKVAIYTGKVKRQAASPRPTQDSNQTAKFDTRFDLFDVRTLVYWHCIALWVFYPVKVNQTTRQ